MPTGPVLGLTAKLGIETDDQQVKRETRSLKSKLSEAAEAEMSADVDTLKSDIASAIESATKDAKWIPDSLGESLVGALGEETSTDFMFDDKQRGRITEQMEALGKSVPGRFGGDSGGGSAAGGAIAGELFSGMKGAGGKFLKVGLAGAVGFGILSKVTSLADAAPRMQKVMSMQQRAIGLFARPFYDFLARFLEGGAESLLNMAANFNEIYAEDGLAVAVMNLPGLFFTDSGRASQAGTAGRVAGGLAGMAGGAYGGAKAGGAIGGAAGSAIPGAGTAGGATAGAIVGGGVGAIGGLLGGAGIGEWIADELAGAFEGFEDLDAFKGGIENWHENTREAIENAAGDFASGVEEAGGNVAEIIERGVDNLTEMDFQELMQAGIEGVEMGWGMIKWVGELKWNEIKWMGSIGWDAIKWTASIGWDVIQWSGSIGWQMIQWGGEIMWQAIQWGGSILWEKINFVGDINIGKYIKVPEIDLGNHINWPGGSAENGGGREFATGGLVTRPTRAVVGEAGPEVIAPFSEFMEAMNSPDRRYGGRQSRPPGGSGDGVQRVVEAIEDLHAEIKRLDPQTELKVDRKTLAKEEQKGRNRYRSSRVITK